MEAPPRSAADIFSARLWRPVPQRRSRPENGAAATDAAGPRPGPRRVISQNHRARPSARVPRLRPARRRPRRPRTGPKPGRLGFHGRRDQVADIDLCGPTRRRVSAACTNPFSLTRGQQEAGILTCMHEAVLESASPTAISRYRQAADRAVPRTVGLQHATMAISTRGATACRSSSWAATLDAAKRPPACDHPRGPGHRLVVRDFTSGTTIRYRCRTSPNPSCAPTRSR